MTSFLLELYPGDAAVASFLELVLKVTIVALVFIALCLLTRRNAPLSHGFALSALVTLLVGPPLFLAAQRSGLDLFHAPVLSPNFPFVTTASSSPSYPREIREGLEVVERRLRQLGLPESALTGRTSATETQLSSPAPVPGSAAPILGQIASSPSEIEASTTSRERSRASQRGFAALIVSVILVWTGGVAWGFLKLAHGFRTRRRILRASRPLTWEDIGCADQVISSRRRTQLYAHPRLPSPITFGWRRPVIVLPERIVSTLPPSQMEAVMVHEGAHIRRGDALVALIQRLTTLVYWPYPLAHFVSRLLSRAREQVCDNHVLQLSGRPEYSRVLVLVAKLLSGRPATSQGLLFLGRNWSLADRVAGVLDERRTTMTRISPWNRFTLALITLSLIFLASTVSGHTGDDEREHDDKSKAEKSEGKPKKQKSKSKQISYALKDLIKLSESLEELGYVEELDSIRSTIVRLERLLVEIEEKEAETERREAEHRIALYRAAIEAHTSAGHVEEADLLEKAVAYLETNGRKDDEAKAIRKERPKKQVRAALLDQAAKQLRENGQSELADAISTFASSIDKKRGKGRSSKKSSKSEAENSSVVADVEEVAETLADSDEKKQKKNRSKKSENSRQKKKSRGKKQKQDSDVALDTI